MINRSDSHSLSLKNNTSPIMEIHLNLGTADSFFNIY